MPRKWTILAICLSCVNLPQIKLSAQTEKDTLPAPGKPIKRELLRFDGRTFEQWQADLLTDLSVNRRVKALSAMRAFAANGFAKEAASAVMELMGGYNIEELGGFLDTEDSKALSSIGEAADSVMKAAGNAAGPGFLRALEGAQRRRRLYALYCLNSWWCECDISFAVLALDKLATDKDKDTRKNAIQVLGRHWGTKGVVEAFARILKGGDRELALDQLGYSSKDLGPLVPEVEKLTSDKEQSVRKTALEVLVKHLPSKNVADALTRVLQQCDQALALEVIKESRSDVQPLVAVIESLTKDVDRKIGMAALESFATHAGNHGVVPALTRLFKEGDARTRLAIASLIARNSRVQSEEARDNERCLLPVTILALQDQNAKVRWAGVASVPFYVDADTERTTQQALAKLLSDSDADLRKLAFTELENRCGPLTSARLVVVQELVAILRRQETPSRQRISPIEFLNKKRAEGKDVLAAIDAVANDKNADVRKAAEAFKAARQQRLDEERRKNED